MYNPENVDNDMRLLASYLNITDNEDEELAHKLQSRVQGSCEWLLKEERFVRWRDRQDKQGQKHDQVYLLTGDPGISPFCSS